MSLGACTPRAPKVTVSVFVSRRAAPSAEFSVDRTRHLMSFLTMMGPSPDWNVGLSAEDLCTKECGWVQKVVQDLIPWDAGTDSGVTYEVCVCLQWQVTDLPARACSGGTGLRGEAGSGSEPDELTVQQGSPAGSHHHVLTSCVTQALGSACPDGQESTGRGSAKERFRDKQRNGRQKAQGLREREKGNRKKMMFIKPDHIPKASRRPA